MIPWIPLFQKLGLLGRQKQVGEISDKTVFACSSGARLPFVWSWTLGVQGEWTCCLSSSVGTLASTSWKWGGGVDMHSRVSSEHRTESWSGATRGFRSELESWERYNLGAGTLVSWVMCMELGNKGYVMDCNKIIFKFCFGCSCRLITSLSEILAQ